MLAMTSLVNPMLANRLPTASTAWPKVVCRTAAIWLTVAPIVLRIAAAPAAAYWKTLCNTAPICATP